MGRYTLSPNLLLRKIIERETVWFRDIQYNWDRIDDHDHSSGKGVQIPATGLLTGSITNTQINNSAAIDGTKISPDFGAQNIETTGDLQVLGTHTFDGTNGFRYNAGIIEYQESAGGWNALSTPTGGANIALSNLGVTQINASLLLDTDNTYDVGSDSKEVKDIWVHNIKHDDSVDTNLTISTEGNDGDIYITPNGTGSTIITGLEVVGSASIENLTSTETVSVAVTAFAGGGQASATQLTTHFNKITTCATAGDSVKLPSTFSTGLRITVKNMGAERADLYPASGDTIEGLAADTAIQVLPNQSVTVISDVADTSWVIV